jgi:membrane fusion protein, heavy metal efflux system
VRNNAALALLALAGLLAACRHERADAPPAARVDGDAIVFADRSPQLGYLTVEAAQERKVVALGLYGRLAWDDDVTVRVFSPVAGRVADVRAALNATVERGDVLAVLRSSDYGQAQADAQKAESELVLAERSRTRVRDLFEHGAAAEKEVEAAEADYAKAKSERARAESALQALSLGHSDELPGQYSLRSPVGGTVVERNLSAGQQVRADQMLASAPQLLSPLFVVTDPTRLWLYLDVTEGDGAALRPSEEVLVHARAFPDKVFHARLDAIESGLDPATRTVKVRCIVDNADALLRAEMYVSADVTEPASASVDVSTKAVFSRENEHFVFVETAPRRFERRPVTLGLESNGRSVVVAGLAAGERVVTEGSLLLEAMLADSAS